KETSRATAVFATWASHHSSAPASGRCGASRARPPHIGLPSRRKGRVQRLSRDRGPPPSREKPATPSAGASSWPGACGPATQRCERNRFTALESRQLWLSRLRLPASPWLFVDRSATSSQRFYRAVAE